MAVPVSSRLFAREFAGHFDAVYTHTYIVFFSDAASFEKLNVSSSFSLLDFFCTVGSSSSSQVLAWPWEILLRTENNFCNSDPLLSWRNFLSDLHLLNVI